MGNGLGFSWFKAEKPPFLVLNISGKLVDAEVEALGVVISTGLTSPAACVIVNLQEVTAIGPRSLALLKSGRERLRSLGKSVLVSGVAPGLRAAVLESGAVETSELEPRLIDAIKRYHDAQASKQRSDARVAPRPSSVAKQQVGVQILIADSDVLMLRGLLKDPWADRALPLIAETGARALEIIADERIDLTAIFIGCEILSPDVVTVVKRAHQLRAGVPITLIAPASGTLPIEADVVAKLGIQSVVRKPIAYEQIVKEFLPPRELFDLAEIMRQSELDENPVGAEVEGKAPDEFVSISAKRFLSGSKCLFDIYVKLNAAEQEVDGSSGEKYLKVTRAGDEFSQDRLSGYISKGITRFYLRREMQEQYIAFCDRVIEQLSRSPSATPESRFMFALDQGEAILSFLTSSGGLKKERFAFASNYMKSLWSLLKGMKDLSQSQIVHNFMAESPAVDHSVSVAMIAAMLARERGMETERSLRIIGISSLFHDIGMEGLPDHFKSENEEQLTEEELSLYRKHPLRGAEVMAAMRGIDPMVIQAITQHHWRRDGSGFPNQAGIGIVQVSFATELVGMADAYVRLMALHGAGVARARPELLEKHVLRAFTADAVDAFKKVFEVK